MKKSSFLFYFFLILCYSTSSFAQDVDLKYSVNFERQIPGTLDSLHNLANNGTIQVEINDIKEPSNYVDILTNVYVKLSFLSNDVTKPALLEKVEIPITLKVKGKSHTSSGDTYTANETLILDPNKNISLFVYQFSRKNSSTQNLMEIDTVSISFASSSISYLDSEIKKLIKLDLIVEGYRYYFDGTTTTVPLAIYEGNVSSGELKGNELMLKWEHLPTTPQSYELEWVYVYSPDVSSTVEYDFNVNAVHVKTDKDFYPVSTLYNPGYLIFRIRTVRPQLSADSSAFLNKIKYGDWGLATAGTISTASPNVYRISGADPLLTDPNWQYTANYANKGKKKEIAHFFDGSKRKRQSITLLTDFDKQVEVLGSQIVQNPAPGSRLINTSSTLVAQESYYSFSGEPVINILPSPIVNSNYFGYQKQINTSNGNKLLKKEYDSIVFNIPEIDTVFPGASNYYSSENPLLNSSMDLKSTWIPNAKGYPYSKVEFMTDGSGRVKTNYTPGKETLIDESKNTSYFYAKPLPSELDKIFGTNIGRAAFYKKNISIDPNGQVSCEYKDIQNRTIATSIVGNPYTRAGMKEIDSKVFDTKVYSDDLIKQGDNIFMTSGIGFELNYPFFVPFQSDYKFDYSFDVKAYMPCTDVCYDCRYAYSFQVFDEYNQLVFEINEDELNFGSSTCPYQETFSLDSLDIDSIQSPNTASISNNVLTLNLEGPNTYTLIKKLKLREDKLNSDAENFLQTEQCGLKNETYFINNELDSTTFNDCFEILHASDDPCWEIKSKIQEDFRWPNGYFVRSSIANTPFIPFIYSKLVEISSCNSFLDVYPTVGSLNNAFNTAYNLNYNPTMSQFEDRFFEFLYKIHPSSCKLQVCEKLNNSDSRKFDKVLERSDNILEFVSAMKNNSFGNDSIYIVEDSIWVHETANDSTLHYYDSITSTDPFYTYNYALLSFDSTLSMLYHAGSDLILARYLDTVNVKYRYSWIGKNAVSTNYSSLVFKDYFSDYYEKGWGIADYAYKYNDPLLSKDDKWEQYKTFYTQVKTQVYKDLIYIADCSILEHYELDPNLEFLGNEDIFISDSTMIIRQDETEDIINIYSPNGYIYFPGWGNILAEDILDYFLILKCDPSKQAYYNGERYDIDTALSKLESMDTSNLDSLNTLSRVNAATDIYNLIKVEIESGPCSSGTLYSSDSTVFIGILSTDSVFKKLLCHPDPYFMLDSIGLTSNGCYAFNLSPIIAPFLQYVKDSSGLGAYNSSLPEETEYNCSDFILAVDSFENVFSPSQVPLINSVADVDRHNAAQVKFKNWMNLHMGLNLAFMDYYKMARACTEEGGSSVFGETVNWNYSLKSEAIQASIKFVGENMDQHLNKMSEQTIMDTLNSVITNSLYHLDPVNDFVGFGEMDHFGNQYGLYYMENQKNYLNNIKDTLNYIFKTIEDSLKVHTDFEESTQSHSKKIAIAQFLPVLKNTNDTLFLIDRSYRCSDGTVWVRLLNKEDSSYYNDFYFRYEPYNYLYELNDIDSITSIKPVFDKKEMHYVSVGINGGDLQLIVQSANKIATAELFPNVILGNSYATGAFPYNKNCEQEKYELAIIKGKVAYVEFIDGVKEEFKNNYINFCSNRNGVDSAVTNESLKMDYSINEFHYTLYYYDRAGNLVQTVPPKGIDTTFDLNVHAPAIETYRNGGQVEVTPDHGYITTYKYNSDNQVIKQTTPNSGSSYFWYDKAGRLVLSQNEKQLAETNYSYTLFDAHNRIVETGEATINFEVDVPQNFYEEISSMILSDIMGSQAITFKELIEGLQRRHVTKTFYDKEISSIVFPLDFEQQNLRSRVATQAFYNFYSSTTNFDWQFAVHYSYDAVGNVQTVLNDYYQAGKISNLDHRFKRLDYYFDPVSNNVLRVYYQLGREDAFIHEYAYDAENRIKEVKTSRDGIIWDKDAVYQYYLHGPLARTELGDQKVQGIDYAYTLNGWLKTVNSAHKNADIGMDNDNSSVFAEDAFGFGLHYNEEDYTPIGSVGVNDPRIKYAGNSNLYNGNIAAMTIHNNSLTLGKEYRYDQLNRLVSSEEHSVDDITNLQWNGGLATTNTTFYTYDGNGNIRTLNRTDGATEASMDKLEYTYDDGTDRLNYVFDSISTGDFPNDLDNQPPGNYTYDTIGNLISDVSEDIDEIRWTPSGKVERIIRENPTKQRSNLFFSYDPLGNRVKKTVHFVSGNKDYVRSTYYVRDASGNTMATYVERNCILEEFQDEKGVYYYQYSYPFEYYSAIAVDQIGLLDFLDFLTSSGFSLDQELLEEVAAQFKNLPGAKNYIFQYLSLNTYFSMYPAAKQRVLAMNPTVYADCMYHNDQELFWTILNDRGEVWIEALRYYDLELDFYSQFPSLFGGHGFDHISAIYNMNRQMAILLNSEDPYLFMDYLGLSSTQYSDIKDGFDDPGMAMSLLESYFNDLFILLDNGGSAQDIEDLLKKINALLLMADIDPEELFNILSAFDEQVFTNAVGWLGSSNSQLLHSILIHLHVIHEELFMDFYDNNFMSFNPMVAINWSLDENGDYLHFYFRKDLTSHLIWEIAMEYIDTGDLTDYDIYFDGNGDIKPWAEAALLRNWQHSSVLSCLLSEVTLTTQLLKNTETMANLVNYFKNHHPKKMLEFVYNYDSLAISFDGLIQYGYSPLTYMKELSDSLGVVFSNSGTCAMDSTYTIPSSYEMYGSSRLGVMDARESRKDDENLYSRKLKSKTYELSNHLGNVVATVSDKKLHPQEYGGSNGYQSDVTGRYDYYPFGMEIMSRSGDFTLVDYTQDEYISEYDGMLKNCGDFTNTANMGFNCSTSQNIYGQQYVNDYTVTHDQNISQQFLIGINARISEIIPNLDTNGDYRIRLEVQMAENDTVTASIGQVIALVEGGIGVIPDNYRILNLHLTGQEILDAAINGKLPIEIQAKLTVPQPPPAPPTPPNNLMVSNIQITQTISNVNIPIAMRDEVGYKYGFSNHERDDEIYGSGNSYDMGARMYNPRIGRTPSIDPHASSYPSLSPYAYVGNMPTNAIDPDGRDIIVLSDPSGAGKAGHQAVLIGNNKDGWTYISKDGSPGGKTNAYGKPIFVVQNFKTVEEFRNSQHNFKLAEGSPDYSNTDGKENKDVVFAKDENGNKIQRYTEAFYIGTTQIDGTSTDGKSIDAAKGTASENYCVGSSDCSDVVTSALSVGQNSEGKPLKTGEGGLIGGALGESPRVKQAKIEYRNDGVDFDEGVKPN